MILDCPNLPQVRAEQGRSPLRLRFFRKLCLWWAVHTPKGRSRERVKECLGGKKGNQSVEPKSQSQEVSREQPGPDGALHLPPSLTVGSPVRVGQGRRGEWWSSRFTGVLSGSGLGLYPSSSHFIKKASKLLSVLSCLPPIKGPAILSGPGSGAVLGWPLGHQTAAAFSLVSAWHSSVTFTSLAGAL